MSPGASTVAAAATAHATAQSRHALPGLTAEHAVTPLIVLHELHVGEGLLTGMLRSTGAAVVVAQDAGGAPPELGADGRRLQVYFGHGKQLGMLCHELDC